MDRKCCQAGREIRVRVKAWTCRYIIDNYLYIFLDEGGNLDFSVNGSKYFSLSCIAMEKSIKEVLARMLPKHTSYRILHHATKAHYGLQVVDYCNWAVFRKWEQKDQEHYEKIKPAIKTEFDIFQAGTTRYY